MTNNKERRQMYMLKKYLKKCVIFILIINIFASSVFADMTEVDTAITVPSPAFTLGGTGDNAVTLTYSMVTARK